MDQYIKDNLKTIITARPDAVRDKFDVTALVLHLVMCKHEFKCEEQDTSSTSTMGLPATWNSNTDSYTFKYKNAKDTSNKTFLIKSLRMGNVLLVNAMSLDKQETIYTLDIDTDKLVKNSNFSDVDNLFMNLTELVTLFEHSIISPLAPTIVPPPQSGGNTGNSNNGTNSNNNRNYYQRPPPQYAPPLAAGGGGNRNDNHHQQQQPWGDDDLYPGGLPHIPNMAFQPSRVGPGGFGGSSVGRDHPGFGNVHYNYGDDRDYGSGLPGFEGRLPRGAVPPGARFDPFGPPKAPGGHNRPDRDDFPPPGFNPPGYM
ncbi:hypothetical protein CYY_000683 [Polysphondylium violaceum]|uniref:Proteasome inhibitor PI31 subunit n=1 Tax=Polysphondylium violaceum TaxID=133409 RepID=A0A8J4V282_9MYCE|nr:hypothetical protein CYY_000683 [Polysphondylium violaceum]